MFAYEREEDEALVIAAGLAEEWLSNGSAAGVKNLPTYYGSLTYSLRLEEEGTLRLKLEGDLVVPPGGIVVMPPLPRPIRQVKINGRVVGDFQPYSFTCRQCPSEAVLGF